jgi:hypothetical protein
MEQPAHHKALESQAMELLNDFMDALNQKDIVALEKTFHFPHFRFSNKKMHVLDKPGQRTPEFVWAGLGADWGRSEWVHMRVVHSSGDKMHVDAKFSRYKVDGSLIGTYESLYVLTYEDNRWGIKMRSSFV